MQSDMRVANLGFSLIAFSNRALSKFSRLIFGSWGELELRPSPVFKTVSGIWMMFPFFGFSVASSFDAGWTVAAFDLFSLFIGHSQSFSFFSNFASMG